MTRNKKMPRKTARQLLLERWRVSLKTESDRAVALITAAYLDDALEALLRSGFIEASSTVDKLLDPEGLLGTFAARMRLAYCLGHISRGTLQDLEIVASIRNKFAHRRQDLDFRSPEVAEACAKLRIPIITPGDKGPERHDMRGRFIETTAWLGNVLQARESEIAKPSSPEGV